MDKSASAPSLRFSIPSWSGWTPDPHILGRPATTGNNIRCSDQPDASSVPPLLRRRLNPMGRACISEMLRHLAPRENIPIVFTSRHGDIERTLKVLTGLAQDQPTSPMDFSLAVHNAIAGVLSIHYGITANISSVAASEGQVVPTLLEALGLLSPSCPRVLCLICDVTLPAIYRKPGDAGSPTFAACFTVATAGSNSLQLVHEHAAEPGPLRHDSPLDFIDFLASTASTFHTRHNASHWRIHKPAQP